MFPCWLFYSLLYNLECVVVRMKVKNCTDWLSYLRKLKGLLQEGHDMKGGGTYLYTWNTSLHITHRVLQWMQCQQAKYNCATPAHCTENVMRCDVHVYKGEFKVFFFLFRRSWSTLKCCYCVTDVHWQTTRTQTENDSYSNTRTCLWADTSLYAAWVLLKVN